MKNILKLGVIALSLLVAVPAFASRCSTGDCGPKKCETRCATPCNAPSCKLPAPECAEIEYTTTCNGTPEYHWECTKVFHPCNDKVTTRRAVVKEKCVGVKVQGQDMPYGEEMARPAKKHHKGKKAHKKSFEKSFDLE